MTYIFLQKSNSNRTNNIFVQFLFIVILQINDEYIRHFTKRIYLEAVIYRHLLSLVSNPIQQSNPLKKP